MMRTDEPSGLSQPLRPQRDRSAYRNFLKMAVLFSINHGTVAAVLNISVQLLGDGHVSFSASPRQQGHTMCPRNTALDSEHGVGRRPRWES